MSEMLSLLTDGVVAVIVVVMALGLNGVFCPLPRVRRWLKAYGLGNAAHGAVKRVVVVWLHLFVVATAFVFANADAMAPQDGLAYAVALASSVFAPFLLVMIRTWVAGPYRVLRSWINDWRRSLRAWHRRLRVRKGESPTFSSTVVWTEGRQMLILADVD